MSDTKEWDEEKEDYANLADEMNDPDVGPWNEDDWDERAVANAKKYAKEHGLPWPPRMGDFDRFYDRENNPRDYPD
jgi:hypothetical protein